MKRYFQIKGDRLVKPTPDFVRDPAEVLRCFRICGLLGARGGEDVLRLCRQLLPQAYGTPCRGDWAEWAGWAAESAVPSAGLRFLKECGWLAVYPELLALDGLGQNPEWHPEGDVLVHTAAACDALAAAVPAGPGRVVPMLAVLCHDMGKALTTVQRDGRTVSPGHAEAGAAQAATFLRAINAPAHIAGQVVPLVREHMVHLQPLGLAAVARVARRLGQASMADLALVMAADAAGSGRSEAPGLALMMELNEENTKNQRKRGRHGDIQKRQDGVEGIDRGDIGTAHNQPQACAQGRARGDDRGQRGLPAVQQDAAEAVPGVRAGVRPGGAVGGRMAAGFQQHVHAGRLPGVCEGLRPAAACVAQGVLG